MHWLTPLFISGLFAASPCETRLDRSIRIQPIQRSLSEKLDSMRVEDRAFRDSRAGEIADILELERIREKLNLDLREIDRNLQIESPEEVALGILLIEKSKSHPNELRQVLSRIDFRSFYPLSTVYPLREISRLFSFRGIAYSAIWSELWWQEALSPSGKDAATHKTEAARLYFESEMAAIIGMSKSRARYERGLELKDVFSGQTRRLLDLEPGPGRFFVLSAAELQKLELLISQSDPEREISSIPLSPDLIESLGNKLDHVPFPLIGSSLKDSSDIERLARTGWIGEFYNNWWWRNSAVAGMTEISGRNSESLAARLYNDKFSRLWRRQVFWPVGSDYATNSRSVELGQVRVALNQKDNGVPLSLEVLVRTNRGDWEPLFFERDGSQWRLVEKINGVPVKAVCMECHSTKSFWPFSKTKLSPRPSFLRSRSAFLRVGYRDEELIKKMLRY